MSSIIAGYNYDIFISYRQKDNKGDHWVSEFVEALKTELESTFKEEISVYFDINPHDGLLETHDVDASLKEKLKCLIFIPIISRTYCDHKSFAWEHEFKAFVEMASKDQFGLKVKLPNGNVANRVLPIRIHDLDTSDISECESVIGGSLRGVDFIYKESGIDKPLSNDDDEKRNLNKTKYKLQIVKVAHAIKEIILGMKNPPERVEKAGYKIIPDPYIPKTEKRKIALRQFKLLAVIVVASVLITTGAILIPHLIGDPLESIRSSGKRISVAVMPFENLTNDTVWNIWQRVVQEELTTYLANFSGELQLRGTESVNGLINELNSLDILSLRKISRNLDADVFIKGSIHQAGNELRLNAWLYDSKRNEPYKSFELHGSGQDAGILNLIDSLETMIVNTLIISHLKNEFEVSRAINHEITQSPEAFRYFFYGINAFNKRDWPAAQNWMLRALKADSNLYEASIFISFAYSNQGQFEEGKKWCLQLYNKGEKLPSVIRAKANSLYSILFETPVEQIRCYRQELIFDEKDAVLYWEIGDRLNDLMDYENAITEFRKSLDLFDERKIKPVWVYCYTELGYAYHMTGHYNLEKKVYKNAERDFPRDTDLVCQQAILSFTLGDTVSGKSYIDEYKSLCAISGKSQAGTTTGIAKIYSAANYLNIAEQYYYDALSMEPDNPERINGFAYFLIDKNVSVNKGLDLIEKALRIDPVNYSYLHTKGWGLFKLGKYQDAHDLLRKSWELRIKNAIYNHQAYLHLEAAKKAVASQQALPE